MSESKGIDKNWEAEVGVGIAIRKKGRTESEAVVGVERNEGQSPSQDSESNRDFQD